MACTNGLRLQSALDHAPGAAADQIARRRERHGRQSFAGEDDIEGVDQIGRGVDQRPVEIEHDGDHVRARRRSAGEVRRRAGSDRSCARQDGHSKAPQVNPYGSIGHPAGTQGCRDQRP
jgi:hypothetical protein